MTTDKGLRKALAATPRRQLPTNFSYRMLQRIEEEQRRREALQERRLFIAMLLTCCLMLGGLIFAGCWFYGDLLRRGVEACLEWLPDKESGFFALPSLVALSLLWFFNRWLKNVFGAGINHENGFPES